MSANKDKSIFNSVKSGQFQGTTSGYIQVVNNKDTLLLDFQSSKTTLSITKDPEEVYDNSTKTYSTQTTSGKTIFTYDIYNLANILKVVFNGEHYSIGNIDGASDTPIFGLSFHYSHEKNTEYLTLFITKPLQLTTTRQLMKTKNINYIEAQKVSKTIVILSGSTIIFTIKK